MDGARSADDSVWRPGRRGFLL